MREFFLEKGKVAIALSGGLDSSVLLAFAVSTLGAGNCLAMTVRTPYMMDDELEYSGRLCRFLGVEHLVLETGVPESIRDNPPLRCYLCKKALFSMLVEEAGAKGFPHVADGTNRDDESDYRPGMKALAELGVHSPMKEAGMGKDDIRSLGAELGLEASLVSKPAYACLLTRLEHGVSVDEEVLRRIDRSERYLRGLGFDGCRVRVHGAVVRIEVRPESWGRIVEPEVAAEVVAYLKQEGFLFVSLDLQGYKQGSMNKE